MCEIAMFAQRHFGERDGDVAAGRPHLAQVVPSAPGNVANKSLKLRFS